MAVSSGIMSEWSDMSNWKDKINNMILQIFINYTNI